MSTSHAMLNAREAKFNAMRARRAAMSIKPIAAIEPVKRYSHDPATREGRAESMKAMLEGGKTLQEVGDAWGLTRERVRQIITRTFGAEVIAQARGERTSARKANADAKRDARCIKRCGVPFNEWRRLCDAGYTSAYTSLKKQAASRGIPVEMTLAEFAQAWGDKFDKRGRGAGLCWLMRKDAGGHYSLANVQVTDSSRAIREVRARGAHHDGSVGVYMLYPGTSKPWRAQISSRSIGAFATQEEAVAARKEALARNMFDDQDRGAG